MTLFDLLDFGGACGKTSPASSTRPTTPSDVSWERLSAQVAPSYRLEGEDGPTQVWLPDHGRGLRGAFSTLNISAWPNDARVCSLSQILEPGPIPRRYYLSARACQGILRRAEKRGKALPAPLLAALTAVAATATTPTRPTPSSPASSPMDRGGAEIGADQCPTLTCQHEPPILIAAGRAPPLTGNPYGDHESREGFDASEDGTGRGTPLVPADGFASSGEPIAFDPRQIHHPANHSNPKAGDPCHPLRAVANAEPAIAQAFDLRGRDGGAQFEGPHDTANIRAASGGSSRSYVAQAIPILESGKRTGASSISLKAGDGLGADGDPMFTRGSDSRHAVAAAYGITSDAIDRSGEAEAGTAAGRAGLGILAEQSPALRAKRPNVVATQWAVRRLTPTECERLQGFPDLYTAIPGAADGPRYKQLGNSFAVNVVRWIAPRIMEAMDDRDRAAADPAR